MPEQKIGGSETGQEELTRVADEKKQTDIVLNAYNYSRNFFVSKFKRFQDWNGLYNFHTTAKNPFRSNLFIPLIYQMIATILPRMVANNPKFRYEPREESDSGNVKKMSTLVDYQLDRMDFIRKLKMWVKDTLFYGRGIVRCYWRVDEKDKYNDPDIDVVDIQDFYPDPKAADIQDGDFMIYRTVDGLHNLKRAKKPDGTPLYKNLEKLEESYNVQQTLQTTSATRSSTVGEVGNSPNISSPYLQSSTKQIESLEYWGVNTEDEENEWVIVLSNRNVVIRAEKNPYKNRRPFIKMHIDPDNHSFEGKGIIEPIEHLQLELNDIRNQRMDNINLILNKLFVVLKDAGVNESELVSRPGGVIWEAIPNGVRILETPDVTQSSYQEESLVKQDAQNTVGVSDIIQGQMTSANESIPGTALNKTATGASIAVQQAGSRFRYYLQNMEDALREFGLVLYEYNQMFLSEEKIIRVEAPNEFSKVQKQGLISKIKGVLGFPAQELQKWQFERINPDEIRELKLDVKVEAGSTQPIDDMQRQQKAQSLMAMIASLPIATPETFTVLAEQIMDAYQIPDKAKIMQTFQIPKPQQAQPNVSVSLRGDLNPMQVGDIAVQAGASKESTNPALAADLMAQEQLQNANNTGRIPGGNQVGPNGGVESPGGNMQ